MKHTDVLFSPVATQRVSADRQLRWVMVVTLLGFAVIGFGQEQQARRDWEFRFGKTGANDGEIQVRSDTAYDVKRGFGFEPGGKVMMDAGCCTGNRPFYFSVALPEGNYKVDVELGGNTAGSNTTVKAELRRLMLLNVVAPAEKTISKTFCVNIRTPQIAGDGSVHLKAREKETEMWDWDQKLTLEFDGKNPSVASIRISPADDLPTIYLLGDSTVCDQPREPWNSWGQMLPVFFKPEIVVANNAESGETLRSSLSARRLDKVLSTIKPDDYLFIQYGHNDMKEKGPADGAFGNYKKELEYFVQQTRVHGATPVLVTSMERKAGVNHPTLGDYPAAVRKVAAEKNVPLIDLNKMSVELYKALGPDLGKAFVDGTHHDNYGSYELAKCVIEGIRQAHLPIAKFIRDDVGRFDPSHPDAMASVSIPASPNVDAKAPLGN